MKSFCFFFIMFYGCFGFAKANSPILITDCPFKQNINTQILFKIKSSNQFNPVQDFQLIKEKGSKFIDSLPYFRNSTSPYLGSFELINTNNSSQSIILKLDNNYITYFKLFRILKDSSYLIGSTGNWIPLNEHQLKDRGRTIEINLGPNESFKMVFELAVKRDCSVNFFLVDVKSYLEKNATDNFIIGIFSGIFIIILIYVLLIYFFTHKSIFLIYGLYVFFTLAFTSHLLGVDYLYFLFPLEKYYGFVYMVSFPWILSFILLTRSFLGIRKIQFRLYRFSSYYIFSYCLLFILTVPWFIYDETFPLVVISYISTFLTVILLCVMLVVGLKKNTTFGYYYLFSFFPIIVAMILFLLMENRIINNEFLRSYLPMIASSSEIIFISIGIAFKLKLEKKQKENLSIELIKKEKQLYSKLEENSVNERIKIAHILHDSFGARLNQIKFLIGVNQLKKANEEVNLLAHDIRDISHAMSPTILNYLSISEATKDLIQSLKSQFIRFHFFSNESTFVLDKKEKVTLYNMIQELIGNSINHGKPKNLTINFNYYEKKLSVSIEDDGLGFNTSNNLEGLGLQSVKERCNKRGWEFRIYSVVNSGSMCTIDLSK